MQSTVVRGELVVTCVGEPVALGFGKPWQDGKASRSHDFPTFE